MGNLLDLLPKQQPSPSAANSAAASPPPPPTVVRRFISVASFPHSSFPTVTQITSLIALVVGMAGAINDALAPNSTLYAAFHAAIPHFHIPSRVYAVLLLICALGNSLIKALSRPPKPGEAYQADSQTQAGAGDVQVQSGVAAGTGVANGQAVSGSPVPDLHAPGMASEDTPAPVNPNQTLTPAFVVTARGIQVPPPIVKTPVPVDGVPADTPADAVPADTVPEAAGDPSVRS